MTTERKNVLLTFLEAEIIRAKEAAAKTDEASKFIMTGPSQSGDRFHAQAAAELAKSYLKHIEELKKEIDGSVEEIKQKIEPVSYIEIQYDDFSKLGFFLVKNAVSLTKFLFISDSSPLGKAILGKKEGETFSYQLEGSGNSKTSFSGRILKVE